jgi:hypothetical protein
MLRDPSLRSDSVPRGHHSLPSKPDVFENILYEYGAIFFQTKKTIKVEFEKSDATNYEIPFYARCHND